MLRPYAFITDHFVLLLLSVHIKQWHVTMVTNGFYLAPVVRRVDNAIHWISRYPADKFWQNKLRYPLDSDLSGGWRYTPFEQLGPVVEVFIQPHA